MKAWKPGIISRIHSHGSVDVKYDTFAKQQRGVCFLERNVPLTRVVLYREVKVPPTQRKKKAKRGKKK